MLKVKTIYDNREEFCAMLRSGRYTQTVGGYARGMTACALQAWFHQHHGFYAGVLVLHDNPLSYIHFAERTLGLPAASIYELNDKGWTFPEIALWIEQQP